MRRFALVCSLVLVAAATASASYQWFENFEDGLAGWNIWTERGASLSAPVLENPPAVLGDIQPWSGDNEQCARVNGDFFNGGIWQVITLPLGAGTYTIDGFWRSYNTSPGNNWAEVIVKEGVNPPINGQDMGGPLLAYKNDTWATSGGWNGQMSLTAPVANNGTFTTAGTITLILKTGNIGGTGGADFDDIWITPEPASLGLFGLASLLLVRRRR